MPADYDVIIIGAGIVGCSTALAFARRGIRTLNLDPLPAAGYGSTSSSSAIVRPFYSHVVSAAVAHESRAVWKRWVEFTGNPDPTAVYHETGGLVLVREGSEADFTNNLAVLDAVGASWTLLDRAQLEKRHPGISLDTFGPPCSPGDGRFGTPTGGRITAAIYIPEAGFVSDSQLAARNLQHAAEQAGAVFRFRSGVISIDRDGASVSGVSVEDGTRLAAPVIINAAGPHSDSINRLAGVKLRIGTRPHRVEVAYLRAPDSYRASPGFIADLDAGVYQRPDGIDMLIGSTDPACDAPDIVDPDHFNSSLTDQWTTQVLRAAQRWPDLGIENTARGTVGLYDVSDDWIPIYDRTDLAGYLVAIGTSGNQFKNAPLIGEIMYSIAMAADHDTTPATLHLGNIDREIDLSFFSRLRQVQSTASVLA